MSGNYMRFPGGKTKALTLSYDDGVEQDIRLLRIMQRYGLKGTFNISSGLYPPEGEKYPPNTLARRLTKNQATELYADSGMEIAAHGYTHLFMGQLSPALGIDEIAQDRYHLEEQFGTIVRGMAYPNSSYSDDVVAYLKHAGIAYARTTVSTHRFDVPVDWLRLPTTCHHDDPHLMELARKFVEEDDWRTPWLFYLWGHSFEFEKHDNWDVIEEFAAYVGNRNDIWYATNIEIYEYVEAYRKLVYTMDGSTVYNPSAVTVYLEKNRIVYTVKPGETMILLVK